MLDRFFTPGQPGDVPVAVAIAEAADLNEIHHGGFLAGPDQLPVPGGLWGEDVFGDGRWGILTLPIPLLHPAAVPEIATALGCSMRPLEIRDGGMVMPGPDNLALARLVHHRNRLRRMMRLEAPALILLQEHRELQLAFEAAITALSDKPAEPAIEPIRWRPMGAPRTEPIPLPIMPAPLAPCGAAMRGDTLLVDFPYVTICVHLPTGRLVDVWRSPGMSLMGILENCALYRHNSSWNHHLFELSSAGWRQSRPVDVPLPPIPPGDQRFLSACGRYAWVHTPQARGDITDASGQVHLTPWWEDTPQLRLPAFTLPGTPPARSPTAMAMMGDEWRILDAGCLWQGRTPTAHIDAWIGAFSVNGERLALIDPERIWLLDVSSNPTMDTELDLRPLRSLMGSVSGPVLHAALCRYGTLVAIAEAGASALNTLEITIDAIGRRRRITREEVGRLMTRARRSSWPDRLPHHLPHRGAA